MSSPDSAADGRDRAVGRWFRSPIVVQFARFLVVGGLSFTIDYGLFLALHHGFGVQYLVASSISFAISVVLNYVLTRRYVFDSGDDSNVAVEFMLYLGLNVIALALNQAILFLAVDQMGLAPALGKIVATFVVLVYNFISRKALIERRRTKPVDRPRETGNENQENPA